MAAAEAGVFSDCAVHLLPYPDVPASQRSALVAKLESHGARVLARFCKQASHVVVLRTHASSAEDQAEGDRELRALFAKISQVQGRALQLRQQRKRGCSPALARRRRRRRHCCCTPCSSRSWCRSSARRGCTSASSNGGACWCVACSSSKQLHCRPGGACATASS